MNRFLMRLFGVACIAGAGLLSVQLGARPAYANPPQGYTLVWSDEFDSVALDTTRWGYHVPGATRYDAINIRDAVSTDTTGTGHLTITTYTASGHNYTGMIKTGVDAYNYEPIVPSGNKYLPRFGYIEAKIDFDGSPGMWSSFYLQSPTYGVPIDDPREAGTEMDIVEHRVHDFWDNDVSTSIPSTIHWDGYAGYHQAVSSGDRGELLQLGYHTYGLTWTPAALTFSIDGIVDNIWTPSIAPDTTQNPTSAQGAPVSQQPEFIYLCSEVKNNDSVGHIPGGGFGSLGSSTTKMKVDFVKHYMPTPSGLTATAASGCQIDLAWTDNAYAEYGYTIERSTDGTSFSSIGTVAAGVEEYQDTGVSRTTRYYYRVLITDRADNTTSNTVNVLIDPAPAVTTLLMPAPTGASNGRYSMAVSWRAPGDDGSTGTASEYDLRYSTAAITSGNFASATRVTTSGPRSAGLWECVVVTGLSSCTTYHFALKTKDAAGTWSAISADTSATTKCSGSSVAQCILEEETAAASVTGLDSPSSGSTVLAVSWTAPEEDGTPIEYDLRYSTATITESNFGSATHVLTPVPHGVGTPMCQLVPCLSFCTSYNIAIKVKDEWGNWSEMSTLDDVSTACSGNQYAVCELGLAHRSAPKEEGSQSLALAPSPNPARNSTRFVVSVPHEAQGTRLRVGVFDIAGRKVRSLVDRVAAQGPAKVEWNLQDDSGQRVAPSLYMVRVDMGRSRKVFPLVVIR